MLLLCTNIPKKIVVKARTTTAGIEYEMSKSRGDGDQNRVRSHLLYSGLTSGNGTCSWI